MINVEICTDPLTNMTNLFGLLECDISRIAGETGTILAIDIISLSLINMRSGMITGDTYIKSLATAIFSELCVQNISNINEVAFRIGGDEFVLILKEHNIKDTENIIKRIRICFQNIMKESGFENADFRTAMLPYENTIISVSSLLKKVHLAIAQAKDMKQVIPTLPVWADSFIDSMIQRTQETLSLLKQTTTLALNDEVSGLPNQRAAKLAIDNMLEEHKSNNLPFSILFIDGDNLKRYNEAGYKTGNEMIKKLGELINCSLRQSDIVYRWLSGDEFIIPLKNTALMEASKLGERIRAYIESQTINWKFPVTISIGIASFPLDGTNIDELLSMAEAALTIAKHMGKNQIHHIE
jgi:FOG: GGDEF domain